MKLIIDIIRYDPWSFLVEGLRCTLMLIGFFATYILACCFI